MSDELCDIALFADAPAAELDWLLQHSTEVHLDTGAFFVKENDPGDRFYIVLDGELQVTRTMNGQEIVLGTTPRGIIGGEISLLHGAPSHISARAIAPSRLLVLDRDTFRAMFAACPTISSQVVQIAAQRTQGLATVLTQQEKMAALGKLSAGLAHELNNPAAAARRAAHSLHETMPRLQQQTMQLNGLGLRVEQITHLIMFQQQATARAGTMQPLAPLEQSDREDELGAWLQQQLPPDWEQAGGLGAWEMAASFVTAGVTLDELIGLVATLPPNSTSNVLAWLHSTLEANGLLHAIEQSTRRISDLVGAVKAYTYMDQAPVQEVDIQKGLEDTLKVLNHKLKQVKVLREYEPELPRIMAQGGELNQVWTNLIDNAIDAMSGVGTLRVITRRENDFVMVEVADSGAGIPPDVLPRIFDPFFTTKEVGVGTGLGLDISYRIIQQHNGTIEVHSQPGHTRFIVRLPTGKT